MTELADARELARMVVRLSERARADFGAAVAGLDIPVLLARAILLVDGRTPMREIAEGLGCDPSYVTGIADQLEERGLAIRTTGKDRRVKMLELTEAGARLRAQVAEEVDSRGPFAHQLSRAQQQTFGELLQLLLAGSGETPLPLCSNETITPGGKS